mgnify:CR=1 FL=1
MWGNSMQNDDMHSAGSCMASGQPPDDALILRIAQGDTAALEVLYRQTSSSIYGFALSILRDPVAAEDAVGTGLSAIGQTDGVAADDRAQSGVDAPAQGRK